MWWPVGDGRGAGPAPPVSARRPASAPARLPPTRTRVTRLVRGDPTPLTYPGSGRSERFLTQSRRTAWRNASARRRGAPRNPGETHGSYGRRDDHSDPRRRRQRARRSRCRGAPHGGRGARPSVRGGRVPLDRGSRHPAGGGRRRLRHRPSVLRPAARAQGVRIPHRRRPQPGLRRRRQPAARPRVDRGRPEGGVGHRPRPAVGAPARGGRDPDARSEPVARRHAVVPAAGRGVLRRGPSAHRAPARGDGAGARPRRGCVRPVPPGADRHHAPAALPARPRDAHRGPARCGRPHRLGGGDRAGPGRGRRPAGAGPRRHHVDRRPAAAGGVRGQHRGPDGPVDERPLPLDRPSRGPARGP